MCNLNLFIKTAKTKNKDELLRITEFLSCVTSNSFKINDDGDGVFFNHKNKLFKSKNKLSYFKYKNNIKNSKFILTHQRFSTSGYDEKFTHPFKNNNFVFAHNGVLRDFAYKNKSDSYNFFKEFNKNFKKSKYKRREKKILNAINTTLLKQEGSFSIILFDKQTQNLYYFKNSNTDINFFRNLNKNKLFITTNNTNDEFLNQHFNDEVFKELEIKDLSLYKIKIKDDEIKIIYLDKIKYKEFESDIKPLSAIAYTPTPKDEQIIKEIQEYPYNDDDYLTDWNLNGYKEGDKNKKINADYISEDGTY